MSGNNNNNNNTNTNNNNSNNIPGWDQKLLLGSYVFLKCIYFKLDIMIK